MAESHKTSIAHALEIMGAWMIQISDIEKHLFSGQDEKREYLGSVSFSPKVLEAHSRTHLLVPGIPLTLQELRRIVPDAFHDLRQGGFVSSLYRENPEILKTRVSQGWMLFRCGQAENIPTGSTGANFAELAYCSILAYRVKSRWVPSGDRRWARSTFKDHEQHFVHGGIDEYGFAASPCDVKEHSMFGEWATLQMSD